MKKIPFYELNNGVKMPSIGLGTYTLNGEILTNALSTAVLNGCTLIDSANAYQNEDSIGNSLFEIYKRTGVNRQDMFITSKVGDKLDKMGRPIGYYFYNSVSAPCHDTRKVVFQQVDESLNNLKTDYLDLLLIHWPYYEVLNEIWSCFEELYEKKIVRAIGVSNCRIRHIERILKTAKISPMVNQINISPINIQDETSIYCKKHNIQIEAYSPLYVLNNQALKANKRFYLLERKYGKTLHQIILHWYYQHGYVPIPKSSNPDRISQNLNIFDFEIDEDDMLLIDALNINHQFLPESKFCPGY